MVCSKVKAILMLKVDIYALHFSESHIPPIYKFKSQIYQLRIDSPGNSNEMTLLSEISILAQKR